MNTLPLLTGIQQIGIGIPDVDTAWKWYRSAFDMNVAIFDDAAEAPLMTRYTNGIVEKRRAALALNMAGGGGFEIWQYTSKEPVPVGFDIRIGDLGIYAAKMKSRNVPAQHEQLKAKGFRVSQLHTNSLGERCFWLVDPWGNTFQVIEGQSWFKAGKGGLTGGVSGAVIGVSDMNTAMKFYMHVLGLREVVLDKTGVFADLPEQTEVRRVILRKQAERYGAFSKLLGNVRIELIQRMDGTGQKIFEGRSWGDRGFIHLCFDTLDMDALKLKAAKLGVEFTVDSGDTFAMGEAGGRFAYMEDPDGTLIELVETHKVPVLKKYGLYFNLKKRGIYKTLPDWMLNLLSLNKIKDKA
jgi:catechol 2,3-dioxygenase-like lactoylglutathione lyase family enzyme